MAISFAEKEASAFPDLADSYTALARLFSDK